MENITKFQIEEILNRLANIELKVNLISEQISDDSVLSEDDKKSIENAEKEYKERKTISHEQLKKELGLKL